jgi:hypothetical protein
MDHFLTQERWRTDQQVLHDQTLEFSSTSFVQIPHSYCPFVISSCVRVGMSGACDFDIRLWRCACGRCLVRVSMGLPGTNSGASPARDPSLDEGAREVSCPPNTLCPFISGCICAPPLLTPLPKPPRLGVRPLFALDCAACAAVVSGGATEAGLNSNKVSGVWTGVGIVAAAVNLPPLPPRRLRGGLLGPAGTGTSALDIIICG